MFCPKSALPASPWLCGTDGWLTLQLFHGGLLTGLDVWARAVFFFWTETSSGPTSILSPRSDSPSVFFMITGLTRTGTPVALLLSDFSNARRMLEAGVFWARATVIGAGLSVTKFFKFPLVTFESKRVETLSESAFCARATVIGAGLSVTRFLRLPLVTLESKRVETLSASDFWARATVIGAGLSVTRFLRFPLVTLLSKRVETLSASDF